MGTAKHGAGPLAGDGDLALELAPDAYVKLPIGAELAEADSFTLEAWVASDPVEGPIFELRDVRTSLGLQWRY